MRVFLCIKSFVRKNYFSTNHRIRIGTQTKTLSTTAGTTNKIFIFLFWYLQQTGRKICDNHQSCRNLECWVMIQNGSGIQLDWIDFSKIQKSMDFFSIPQLTGFYYCIFFNPAGFDGIFFNPAGSSRRFGIPRKTAGFLGNWVRWFRAMLYTT